MWSNRRIRENINYKERKRRLVDQQIRKAKQEKAEKKRKAKDG